VPISCKEIAAFLLTCLFGRVISLRHVGLAGFDDILITLAQNIMKI
jgi:hypothetical protein